MTKGNRVNLKMPRLLRKLAGFGIGYFVFAVCALASLTFVGVMDQNQVAANKAAWGAPVACTITNPKALFAIYSTSVREVDVVCPSFSRTILVSQQDSLKSTMNVWTHAKTGQVFISDDRISGGGNTINREPPVGTMWLAASILLIPLSIFFGFATGFYFNQWKRWSIRADAA